MYPSFPRAPTGSRRCSTASTRPPTSVATRSAFTTFPPVDVAGPGCEMATFVPRATPRWSGRVPATLPTLASVRVRLARALEASGWNDAEAFRVLVCADEAAANALTHGSRADGTVTAGFAVTRRAARITFADDGARAESIPAVSTAPDDASEHGRGLLLMRALSDRMSVRRRRGRTVVKLGFRRSGAEVPAR